ncbi:hypothetical protein MKY29_11125 [Psychrobacillus sp. FSL K6-2365]|uniref:hypothetical protein n=1 Tax=Psychrobacillus sp. FSL K6-2365 TaxID=2921546 RepID=UPI0030F5478D
MSIHLYYIQYYGLKNDLSRRLSKFPTILDLEEGQSEEVKNFLPFLLNEMEYDKEVLNEKLDVFTFNQIIGYIETSVNMGLLNIKLLSR